MWIIVAGSRTVSEGAVRTALSRCPWLGYATGVVSGTAKGADQIGEKWAAEHGLDVIRFPANWKRYGRGAGPVRNRMMAEKAHGLVAVWDGQSRGTTSMINLARQRGLRVFVHRTDEGSSQSYDAAGVLADIWQEAEERAAMKLDSNTPSVGHAEREAAREVVASRRSREEQPNTIQLAIAVAASS